MSTSPQASGSALVSVLIPAYNVESYIERCLNCVFRQTYAPLECVIIDDCSSDRTSEIINARLHDYQGDVYFNFIQQEKNIGVAATRNHLVEAARGNYLFFLDSDDEMSSDCINKMMSCVEAHPDIEIVQGMARSIPDNTIYHWERYDNIDYMDDNNWLRLDFFKNNDNFPCQVWNKLISASFIKTNHLSFIPGIIHEDQHWMIHAARKLSKFAFVHQCTYIRHYRDNSIMTTSKNFSQNSNDSWAVILMDALNTIDHPYPIHQLNKLASEFLYRSHSGSERYKEVEKALARAMTKERLYIGCVLLFLFSHIFTNKGNWRCQNLLLKYLSKKALEEERPTVR